MFERGDIVTCVLGGDYGKPRPAVVVQSDLFNETHASFTICPLTSHLIEAPLFRLAVIPSEQNGLQKPSQIMVDKISSVKKERLHQKIGKLNLSQIQKLNEALKLWLDLAAS